MKKRKNSLKSGKQSAAKLFAVSLVMIIFLQVFYASPFLSTVPVAASEEEEEDNFTTMPNFRWKNETTTDDNVQEKIDGSQYNVYTINNETSGTEKFEKSRLLNSRDFYLESRFQIDNGGNTIEFFRDVLGDPADFSEDIEGFISHGAGTTLSLNDGIISWFADESDDGITITLSNNLQLLLYDILEVRVKTTESGFIACRATDGSLRRQDVEPVTGDIWETITFNLSDAGSNPFWDTALTSYDTFRITSFSADPFEMDFPLIYYIDSIKILSVLDYATHTEDIGDIWDWSDSTEYFFDDLGNVSDFNDGTTENYVAVAGETVSVTDDGWLNVSEVDQAVDTIVEGLNITAAIHRFFAFEIDFTIGDATDIVVRDAAGNEIHTDATGWSEGDVILISFEADGDWTGVETGVRIDVAFNDLQFNSYSLNFTYIYDTSLGNLENFDVVSDYGFVEPDGVLSFVEHTDVGGAKIEGLNIDTTSFNRFKGRIWSDTTQTLNLQDWGTGTIYMPLALVANTWVDFDQEFTDPDWTGTIVDIYFRHTTAARIKIDYALLLGQWSNNSGFKFSLLNSDNEEGMYFEFIRPNHTVSNYTINIAMLDITGISLSFSQSFEYSISTNAWLHLDVDWNIDKKIIKVLFEYENKTEIIKTRSLTELFGSTSETSLLLMKEGFPSLCLNNSMLAISHSLIIIDYIDADWDLLEWTTPDVAVNSDTDFNFSSDFIQDADSAFTTINPNSASMVGQTSFEAEKWFWLDVDRFDGVSFDLRIVADNLDAADLASFWFSLQNVDENGTLTETFSIAIAGGQTTSLINIYSSGINIMGSIEVDPEGESKSSVSIFYESEDKLAMDYTFDSNSNQQQRSAVHNAIKPMTKEFVVIFAYRISTVGDGFADDIIDISVGGFDLVRKDLLKDIVSAVLSPIVFLIQLVLAPLIILLQFLGSLFSAVIELLADILTGALEALGDVLAGILDSIGEILGDVFEALGLLAQAIFDIFEVIIDEAIAAITALAESIWDAFLPFLEDLIDALLLLVDTVIGFVAAIFFAIYDGFWTVLGVDPPPDLIAIASIAVETFAGIIAGLPAFFVDLMDLLFAAGIWLAIIMFAFNWIVPALKSDNMGDFMADFVDIATMDVTGGISIIGFNLPIPFIAVWLPLLSLHGLGII